jgi:hypothetical protein
MWILVHDSKLLSCLSSEQQYSMNSQDCTIYIVLGFAGCEGIQAKWGGKKWWNIGKFDIR